MNEARDHITVQAVKVDDWRDLYEMWTDPRICRGLAWMHT